VRKLLLVTVAAGLLLSGCGLFPESKEEKIERLIKDNSRQITVLLRTDITENQRTAVEDQLRRLPDVTEVTFADGPANFRKIQQDAPAEAREKLLEVGPEHWPPSFTVTVRDVATARRIRDSPTPAELEKLPGVADVVFRCTTVEECRNPSPAPSPS
jgi:cell division transport system permease protein